MRILGIDPGFAIVGYGIVDYAGNRFSTVHYGSIETKAHTPFVNRLLDIYRQITNVISTYQPDAVAIEELFFNTNVTTGIQVGHARGVLMLAAAEQQIPVFEYTPLQVKQATVGYGRADKNQVQQMVKSMLGLPQIPKPDDVADALAIAVCHAHSYHPTLSTRKGI